MKLIGFDFEIYYWVELKNKADEALSRILVKACLDMITVPSLLDIEVVEKEFKMWNWKKYLTDWCQIRSVFPVIQYEKANCLIGAD